MTKAERTRHYIIEESFPVFNKKGFSGTSMSDVCNAVGLTKGAIYGNFRNKDEIALAVLDHQIKKIRNDIRVRMEASTNNIEKLLFYYEYWKERHVQFIDQGGCPILNTAIDADDTHPELLRRAKGFLRLWEKMLVLIMEAGKEAGEVKVDIDSRRYARIFIALTEGGVMLAKVLDDHGVLLEMLEEVKRVIHTEIQA
jgi:AcrR family transcriptional regulator